MILSLVLPRIGGQMTRATLTKVLAAAGDELRPGTPLLELRVDFGADKVQDCPPVGFFRLIATERATLRRLAVTAGGVLEPGALLGLATSSREESDEGTASRALRTTSVAIQIDPLSR